VRLAVVPGLGQDDPAVQRGGVELHREASVAVAPGDADPIPETLPVLAVAHLVRDQAGLAVLDSGVECCFVRHLLSPLLSRTATIAAFLGPRPKTPVAGSGKLNYGGHPLAGRNRHSACQARWGL